MHHSALCSPWRDVCGACRAVPLCREASGVNAGTLTMQMTRVALIPYALRAHAMWADAANWLGHDVGVVVCDGLSLAFTEHEEELLSFRATKRREAGAPINLIERSRGPRGRAWPGPWGEACGAL